MLISKLIDFGKANYEHNLQATPPFLAPELLKGARPNFLSDLYSLGVIELLLNKPYPLSLLKDLKIKDFNQDLKPLLSLDPAKRAFTYKTRAGSDLKSLSYKVRDLLSVREARLCSTLKKPYSRPPVFLNWFKRLALVFVLALVGMADSQPYSSSYGWLKIYTQKWFIVRVGSFESYTPFKIPLKEGWHFIEWQNKNSQGRKKVFISKKQPLFLNDQHLLNEGT